MTPPTAPSGFSQLLNSMYYDLRPVFTAFAFMFGASIGSFLNVVIYRVPRGLSVANPRRSFCPNCKNQIKWYDNIPIFSYIILRAKCRNCALPIAIRYPLVELLCALLFVAVLQKFGPTVSALAYWTFSAALLALTFIDVQHFILPNGITYPLALIGLGASFFMPQTGLTQAAIGALAGFGLVVLINLLWYVVRKQQGLGFGDAGLMCAIGAFLGFKSLFFVFLAGSLQGLAAALLMHLFGKLPTVDQIDDYDPLHHNHIADYRKNEESGGSNEETNEPQPAENAPENNGEKGANKEAEAGAEDEKGRFSKLVIPFGPFLALGAIEYMFFGQWLSAFSNDMARTIISMLGK